MTPAHEWNALALREENKRLREALNQALCLGRAVADWLEENDFARAADIHRGALQRAEDMAALRETEATT